jgi:hypothetical protein
VAAAEDRDAEEVAALLSESFRGKSGLAKADAVATLRRYFAAYETIALTLHEVEVEPRPDGATARCLVEFSGGAKQAFGLSGPLPSAAVYRFALELADEGGIWRVRQADWEVVPLREP